MGDLFLLSKRRMVAIAQALTSACAAEYLGEDEDLLHEISSEISSIGMHGLGGLDVSPANTSR